MSSHHPIPSLAKFFCLLAGSLFVGPHAGAADLPTAGRLVNLSARAMVVDGDPLIAGFVVAGDGTKSVLLRGVGPALTAFSVAGALGDSVVTLFTGAVAQTVNDDWGAAVNSSQIATAAAGAGAFALPAGSRDAALLSDFSAGNYTAHVTAKAGANGVALVELYDAAPATPAHLANFSARARIGTGAGILIAGFAIQGPLPVQVLIRGIGPALGGFGVTSALPDPQLTLFRQGTAAPLAQNDNWGGTPTLKAAFAATGAFALGDTSRDAALLVTLDPGTYTAQVSGVGGAIGPALVEIYDATPVPTAAPAIVIPPAAMAVPAGTDASLTVIASSPSPLAYQWFKDGIALAGATADTLRFPSLQSVQAGSYTVAVANTAGTVTSAAGSLTVVAPPASLPPAATFDLAGFATVGAGTTGGGVLAPGDANYHLLDATIVNPASQLRTWLESAIPAVVDVQVDVDLGALNNVGNRPRTNPELMASGIGVINLRANKTVFSSTGATLRHGTLNISGQNNIIVRNLRFRGLWEFDEGSQNPPDNAPWGYKIQDWDYIDVQNGARNVWIDHCDFEKAYDGIADVKAAADLITFSWCRFGGDTGGAVARQISYLEKLYQGQIVDSRVSHVFYDGLRNGVYVADGIPPQSVRDIIEHELPHDKCDLIGSADTATGDIGFLNLTFHHLYYRACRQRLPRMRFGNAHVYDVFVDNSAIVEGTNMATASTCDAAVFAENNYYLEVADPFPAQSGTSPPGRAAQAGCKWILRGADTSMAGNSFLRDPATWTWNTATKNFIWSAAPAPNARNLPYSYQLDPVDYPTNNLASIGVITPTNSADRATLAAILVRTAH